MNEDRFMELLNETEFPCPPSSQEEIDSTLALALARAGLPGASQKRPRSLRRRVLTLAFAASVSVLALAAAYYSVTDAFRGVLNERGANGEPIPVSSMAPVVESAGMISGESVTANGLTVTLRGVVGSPDNFKILLDLTGPAGKPLAYLQDDGTYSTNDVRFKRMRFAFDSVARGSGGSGMSVKTFKTGPGINQATILLEANTQRSDRDGARVDLLPHLMTLTLTDLCQMSEGKGKDAGFLYENARELLEKLPPAKDSSFDFRSGWSEDEHGNRTYDTSLWEHGTESVPLFADYPGIKIDNIGIRNDTLCLTGSMQDADEDVTGSIALRRKSDGYLWTCGSQGMSSSDSNGSQFDMAFRAGKDQPVEGPLTPELLEQYELVVDAGNVQRTIIPGEWKLNVRFNQAQTIKQMLPDQEFLFGGITFNAEKLTLSPMSLALDSVVRDKDKDRFEAKLNDDYSNWPDETLNATLYMKDGTTMRIAHGGSSSGDGRMDFSFDIDLIIDPNQVERIAIGNMIVPVP